MLVSLGRRSPPEDLVGLLLECHQRIVSFLNVAVEVGRRADLSDAERAEACRACERYFTEALPLHVADEEESLLPRLLGKQPQVDEALRVMQDEHVSHARMLEALLLALRAVCQKPEHPLHRQRLLAITERLAFEFGKHLSLEERVLFPAVRTLLSSEEQEQILQELRRRRTG